MSQSIEDRVSAFIITAKADTELTYKNIAAKISGADGEVSPDQVRRRCKPEVGRRKKELKELSGADLSIKPADDTLLVSPDNALAKLDFIIRELAIVKKKLNDKWILNGRFENYTAPTPDGLLKVKLFNGKVYSGYEHHFIWDDQEEQAEKAVNYASKYESIEVKLARNSRAFRDEVKILDDECRAQRDKLNLGVVEFYQYIKDSVNK